MEQVKIWDVGKIRYEDAYRLQKRLVAERCRGAGSDMILCLEHDPVFTVGRQGRLRLNGAGLDALGGDVPMYYIDRGGDITFHGPGQLVIYPILKMGDDRKDVRGFMREWEDIIIELLKKFGLSAVRRKGYTGVWLNDREKIASMGFGFSRWVSYHGIGLNVTTDKKYFQRIEPCGLAGIRMINIADCLSSEPRENLMEQCKKQLYLVLKERWGREISWAEQVLSQDDAPPSEKKEKSSLQFIELC